MTKISNLLSLWSKLFSLSDEVVDKTINFFSIMFANLTEAHDINIEDNACDDGGQSKD